MGDAYENSGKVSDAMECYRQALKMSEDAGYMQGISLSLYNIGYTNKNQGNSVTALDYCYRSLKIDEALGDKEGIATVLNTIGYIFDSQGRVKDALYNFQRSLKIREEIGDLDGIATTLNNMGYIYDNQGQPKEALKYYERSLKIREETGDKSGVALALNNIGSVYIDQGNDDLALGYYQKALKLAEEVEDRGEIAHSLSNIGSIYKGKGFYESALHYFERAMKLREALGYSEDIISSHIKMANVYLLQEKWQDAKRYSERALEMAKRLGFPELIGDAAEILASVYEKEGSGMKALGMHKLYIQMRDSIKNLETQKAFVSNQFKSDYEKKAAADSISFTKEQQLQEAKIAQQQAEIKAKKNQQYALFGGLALVILFAGFMYNRFKITNRQKSIIELQKHEVEQQKVLVEVKNKEITDSINYAKRIQAAILPSSRVIREFLPESFVMYKPKDIVAGDFYWMERKQDKLLFAVADCTGHGVPGAMVSVICNNGLNRSVRENNLTIPGEILNKTRELVISEFEKSEEDVQDGMDISLCSVKANGNNIDIEWAGANTSLFYFHKGELLVIHGHKQPIGKVDNPQPFPTNKITLAKGDAIYLLSDGFADQFGGPKGKKFKNKKLQELLRSVQSLSMDEQKKEFNRVFEEWRGDMEQVDDVTLAGIRF